MPFMYPEQLRELRSQYPNTQFDGHGRVTGGMPLDQYNAQTANPAAIPASVRTYSQFDPATNSWVRHTNGAAPVQSPAPASTPASVPVQGTPINFQQVLGYTPAGFEGATLNVGGSGGGRVNVQPAQVMRPLPRNNQKDNTYKPNPIEVATALAVPAGSTANLNITPNFNKLGWGTQEVVPKLYTEGLKLPNPIRRGIRVPTQVNANPVEVGQPVPVIEATPTIRGNGFLTWLGNTLGFHSSSNLDPTLSNHSDPRR